MNADAAFTSYTSFLIILISTFPMHIQTDLTYLPHCIQAAHGQLDHRISTQPMFFKDQHSTYWIQVNTVLGINLLPLCSKYAYMHHNPGPCKHFRNKKPLVIFNKIASNNTGGNANKAFAS